MRSTLLEYSGEQEANNKKGISAKRNIEVTVNISGTLSSDGLTLLTYHGYNKTVSSNSSATRNQIVIEDINLKNIPLTKNTFTDELKFQIVGEDLTQYIDKVYYSNKISDTNGYEFYEELTDINRADVKNQILLRFKKVNW